MRAAYTGVQKLRKKLCIQYKNATAHYKNNIGMSALDPTGPNISNIDTNGMHTPFNIHGNAFASSASSASSAAFAATTAVAAAVSSTATSAQQAQTNINNYLGKDNLIVFQEYLLKQLNAEKDDDIFTPDGHFGEQTTRGLQSLLAANETELKVDGILGENTIRRLQSFVNKEILRRNIGNTILEDGDLGEKTLKALERLILREKAVARLNKVKPQHEFQFRMSLDIDDANVDEENKRLLKEHLQPQTRAFHPMHVGIKVERKYQTIYVSLMSLSLYLSLSPHIYLSIHSTNTHTNTHTYTHKHVPFHNTIQQIQQKNLKYTVNHVFKTFFVLKM